MNDYGENFKGVRFPKDLWLDDKISTTEKLVLLAISNLWGEYSSVTNNDIANFIQCSRGTVTKAISNLKKLGYIENIYDDDFWTNRTIKLMIKIQNTPFENEYERNAFIINTHYQNEEQ